MQKGFYGTNPPTTVRRDKQSLHVAPDHGYMALGQEKSMRKRCLSGANVVIVIPTHSRTTLLKRTLASLLTCQMPRRVREIRVIENGSTSGAQAITEEFAEKLPVKYVHIEQANKSVALNFAIADLNDELVIFFDDDLRFSRQTIEAYCSASDRHPEQRFFGGPFRCDYEITPAHSLIPYLPLSARGWSSKHSNTTGHDFFIGFNWAAYARDIRACGYFDERFGPGSASGATGQETTLQKRLLQSNCTPCYVPSALVWHYVPEDRCSLGWAIERMYRNGLQKGQLQADEMQRKTPPRWMWRKLFEAYVKVGYSYWRGNDENSLRARMELQLLRGTMEGICNNKLRTFWSADCITHHTKI